MSPKELEDYIQEGLYGARENLPEERAMYLGSLRERVELALTVEQVMADQPYKEITDRFRQGMKLLLNASIPYRFLSKYIQAANTRQIPFTLVQQEGKETPIGLLLVHETAVDRAEIFIRDALFPQTNPRLH